MAKISKVEKHFDKIAKDYDYYKKRNSFYYTNLKKLLSSLIPKNKQVLEIGCGTGEILASLQPTRGYGMDLSQEMITIAKQKHSKNKKISFSTSIKSQTYNYIYMTDVIEHLEKPLDMFFKIESLMDSKSVFINTMANPLWEPLLMFWERQGWKMPEGPHKRLSFKQINYLINKAGMKIVKHDYKLLIPIKIPVVTKFVNKYLEQIFRRFAFVEYFVAVKA